MANRNGTFYLVLKPGKWPSELKGRLANKLPSLAVGEVPVKIDVNVPDALFKRAQLQAKITIPESAVTAPVVTAEVLDNVREILSQQTGLDVTVSLVEQV